MEMNENKVNLYGETFEALDISQIDLARLMSLGSSYGQSTVSLKISGKRGVSSSELLAGQLLLVLKKAGVDIRSLRFDHAGKLIGLNALSERLRAGDDPSSHT